MKHFSNNCESQPSTPVVFSLETALTVIYLTVIGHENNKPTCLFLLGPVIIIAAGPHKENNSLLPQTRGYRSELQ